MEEATWRAYSNKQANDVCPYFFRSPRSIPDRTVMCVLFKGISGDPSWKQIGFGAFYFLVPAVADTIFCLLPRAMERQAV